MCLKWLKSLPFKQKFLFVYLYIFKCWKYSLHTIFHQKNGNDFSHLLVEVIFLYKYPKSYSTSLTSMNGFFSISTFNIQIYVETLFPCRILYTLQNYHISPNSIFNHRVENDSNKLYFRVKHPWHRTPYQNAS